MLDGEIRKYWKFRNCKNILKDFQCIIRCLEINVHKELVNVNNEEYIRLLDFFDKYLWDRKIGETNFNYNGLILDSYFDDSVLGIDYLNIEDYFNSNGGFNFNETEFLSEQFKDVSGDDRKLKLIENILNILKKSTYNKETSDDIISKALVFLKRNGVIVNNIPDDLFKLMKNNIIDEGHYCYIIRYKNEILKKELKEVYKGNPEFQKRMKYEYENMQKLQNCSQVLNVYCYDSDNFSYLMEEADMNLFEYIDKVEITFEQKIKIIYDMLKGMKYAHEHNIIHRDLHPGNILKIKNDFVISDFGLSKDESIERSLKSSSTKKTSHLFIDPSAHHDFRKLDKKSDIYSIGKLIDYILNARATKEENVFTFIVEKCTSRQKEKRYETVEQILSDIELKLKEQNGYFREKEILEKIQNGIFDMQVNEHLINLVKSDRICDYLVKYKLSSFGKIILQMKQIDQLSILEKINHGYEEATGYGKFENYDIFAKIAHDICLNTSEKKIYSIAKVILEGCAQYRFSAEKYLEKLNKDNL